jgi:hypothetical protein
MMLAMPAMLVPEIWGDKLLLMILEPFDVTTHPYHETYHIVYNTFVSVKAKFDMPRSSWFSYTIRPSHSHFKVSTTRSGEIVSCL